MFTGLEHTEILYGVSHLIDLCFRNSGKQLIAIGYKNVYYSNVKSYNNTVYLDKWDCKNLVEFLLNNTYIQFAGKLFKQVIGVPMGANSSPALADCTLAWFEFEFLSNPRNSQQARQANHSIRYIDDILSVNNPNFSTIADTIYPKSLPLECTSQIDRCNYLDMSLDISSGGKLGVKIFQKTDSFNFPVIRYGFHDSNVHSSVGTKVFYSELIRFARVTNDSSNFCLRSRELFECFVNHGYPKHSLVDKIIDFLKNNGILLNKFGFRNYKNALDFMSICFGCKLTI